MHSPIAPHILVCAYSLTFGPLWNEASRRILAKNVARARLALQCYIPRNAFALDAGKDAGSATNLAEKSPIADTAAEQGLGGSAGQGKASSNSIST